MSADNAIGIWHTPEGTWKVAEVSASADWTSLTDVIEMFAGAPTFATEDEALEHARILNSEPHWETEYGICEIKPYMPCPTCGQPVPC